MRIGELASQTGVTAQTIRFYERTGVLAAPTRTPSGYRDYDDDAVARLGFVRSAQTVGLSLAEIRDVLGLRDQGETPCEHVVGILVRRAGELDVRIAELATMRDELRRLAQRAATLDPRQCDPANICHVIPDASPGHPVGRHASGPPA